MGETAPFWRFSAASYPDLEETIPVNALVRNVKRPLNGNPSTSPGVWFLFHSTSECMVFLLLLLLLFLLSFSILFLNGAKILLKKRKGKRQTEEP